VLGQLFLIACVLATLSVAAILVVLYGPVPVKKRVVVVPRLTARASVSVMPAAPSLVAQLAPAPEQSFSSVFTATIQGASPPAYAAAPAPSSAKSIKTPPPLPLPVANTPPPVPMRKPAGAKVQPLAKSRSARGTGSPGPLAPVVRPRQYREEDVVTDLVPRQDSFEETEELTVVED
jgi:hypothetical protein